LREKGWGADNRGDRGVISFGNETPNNENEKEKRFKGQNVEISRRVR